MVSPVYYLGLGRMMLYTYGVGKKATLWSPLLFLSYFFAGNFVLHHFTDAVQTLFTQSRTLAITIPPFSSCTLGAYEGVSRHMIVQIGTSNEGEG